MRHLWKYLVITILVAICLSRYLAEAASAELETGERVLIDLAETDAADRWWIVNDGVMGGISQSKMTYSDSGTAIFSGTVSMENNGGFASVRTGSRSYGLGGHQGLTVRVRGDGKTYQVRMRTDDRFDGPSYRQHFEAPANTWTTVRLPFSAFVPTFRGRVLRRVPKISPESIQQIGFLIADEQAGRFRLEIDWVGAYR